MKRNENRLTDLLDNITYTNIHVIGVPEEETMKGAENMCEDTVAKHFTNLEIEQI